MQRSAISTFYPSAHLEGQAQPVRLAAGEQQLGIDIQLVQTPVSRVSGRVTLANGLPARDAVVTLRPEPDAGMMMSQSARTDPGGRFLIPNMPTGQYAAFASTGGTLPSASPSAGPSAPYESMRVIVAVAGEATNIDIQLSQGFDVRGRLLVDGAPPAPPSALAPRLFLRFMQQAPADRAFGTFEFDPSGAFTIKTPPGRFDVSFVGLPAGSMIMRVLLNGRDVTDEGFDVVGPVVGLEIAATTKPGVMTGTVTAATGERVAANVLVFSENSRFWTIRNSRYFGTASALASSDYSVRQLPAGRYLSVAVASFDPLTWADPENLSELRKMATPFTMPETGTITVHLVRR
jgi:hypothetical protein